MSSRARSSDGSTLPSARVTIRPTVDKEIIAFAGRDTKTDENGFIDFDGVLPGLEYWIWERKSKAARRSGASTSFTVVLAEE